VRAQVIIHFTLVLSLCLGYSLASANSTGASTSAQPVNREAQAGSNSIVKIAIRQITEAKSPMARWDRTKKLSQWVAQHPKEVSLTDVEALAGLMSDPDDGLRGWIAGALGQLGGKAKVAVPQLQWALQDRPCENRPANSASAIRLALSRIGAEPVKAVCTDPFGAQ
jgi:hypothetical protein